ncbi:MULTISPECIES: restriction endonuclease subunit S [Morganellaceae]|uniref:Restriction endonuclease subunit S n=1 Tax=Providencia rettgeri TaxID=587 RepID=A0AAD2VWL4_PRORE|nr:restriction endonuclease subunit S [Morganella morganii]ELR5219788.1 restriction endonuclease subunit S [Providencia rettgeri]MDQ6200119.1 restriction endonuclease subunit S [Morganella morganii]HCT4328912.1 restriction endonuclease subunit S [Morganella morganii]HEI9770067.1 restriction endonuclease subunit S [Morganella morganii]
MVPNGWQKVNLKSLLSTTIKNGYSPNAVEQETGYVVLGLGALTDNKLDARNIKNVEATEQVLKSQLSHGDFLISRSNTPDKVGRSCMFRGEVANCSYPDLMMKFRANEVFIEPVFLEIYLQSSRTRQYFQNCAAGSSSSMVKITKSVVEKAPVLLPPLLEQRKIAQILSTWDRGIATTEKLIDVSKQQKKALMQHLLTGKKRLIDPETGKAFEREWKTIKIKDVFKAKTTRAKDSNYTTYSVTKNGIVSQENYFNKSVASQDTSNYKVIEFGDFVMSGLNFWMGSVDIYLNKTKGIISPAYKTFSVSNDVDLKFMYQFVRSDKFNQILVDSSIVGASVVRRNFNSDVFFNWGIGLPSMREQQKISSVLTAADNEIEFLETKLAHLKLEKKALMQQLLTGKRRVKV